MKFLYLCDLLERLGYLWKSFITGNLLEINIKRSPFKIFPGSRMVEVLLCTAYYSCRVSRCNFQITALKVFEKDLGMLFFVFSRFQEKGGNLL